MTDQNKFNIYGSYNKGWNFYCEPNRNGNTVFFAALGWRVRNTSLLDLYNLHGGYWTAGASNSGFAFYLRYYTIDGIQPYWSGNTPAGFNIRSVIEVN